MQRDEELQGKSPRPAEEQDKPAQERPVPQEEIQRAEGQPSRPSQAEGERDKGPQE